MKNRTRAAKPAIATLAALLWGCSNPSAPLRGVTLVGDFGNGDANLHADNTSAFLEMTCSAIRITSPLTTDGAGAFSVTGSRMRTGGAPPLADEMATPVRVNGRAWSADKGTIQLVITPIAGVGIPPADTFVVVRNRVTTLLQCP